MPQEQFQAFLLMIGAGMAAGLCYDLYRVTRSSLGLRRLGSSIGDILFWFLMTPFVFAMLLYGNWGELRLYVLLGLGCGLALYLKLGSRLATEVIRTVFMVLNRFRLWLLFLLVLVWRVFTLPARLTFLVLGFPVQMGARAGSMLWQPVARHFAPGLKNRWRQVRVVPGRIAKLLSGKKKT
jgi:spore cortex biosynthesis protein YabQ